MISKRYLDQILTVCNLRLIPFGGKYLRLVISCSTISFLVVTFILGEIFSTSY